MMRISFGHFLSGLALFLVGILFFSGCGGSQKEELSSTMLLDSLVLNFDSLTHDWIIEYVKMNHDSDTTSIGLQSLDREAYLRLFYNNAGEVDLIRYFPSEGHEARLELDTSGLWLCLERVERDGERHIVNQYWLEGDGTKTFMGSSEYWKFDQIEDSDSCWLSMVSFQTDSIGFTVQKTGLSKHQLGVETVGKGLQVSAMLPCNENMVMRSTLYSTLPTGEIMFYYRRFETNLDLVMKPGVTIGTGRSPLKVHI